ncbi:MAG: hypothetical protein KDA93_19780 [Planctomycetaceae bacterium]|nr:hypothetical protein [Planctomycetaceae bacterium]
MSDHHERAMLLFAQLASIADRKQQSIGRDRFLVLTGIAATCAGWPEVAARCLEVITSASPQHIVGRYPSFAAALRDDEFMPYVRQVEKFCSAERAEHLLAEMRMSPPTIDDEHSAGDVSLELLDRLPPKV